MNSPTYCIILSGGIGNRFWPVSSKNRPKQFCDILNTGKSFLRQSYERMLPLFQPSHIFVITGKEYAPIVEEQIPELPVQNILKEPCIRNTATCIAYATYRIQAIAPDASLVIIPSDHFITNDFMYLKNITEGINFVENQGGLLTIGIPPTRIETQYGYIQTKQKNPNDRIVKVKTFTEKPSAELAKIFYESKEFLWNAGIFIAKVSDLVNEYAELMYNVHALFSKEEYYGTPQEESYIDNIYGECHNVSIDVGILERSQNVYVLKGEFGWSDVGTWHVFHELSPQDEHRNSSNSPSVVFDESSNCIVNIDTKRNVIIEGMNNVIVAEKDNYLMICNREKEDKIKRFDRHFSEQ